MPNATNVTIRKVFKGKSGEGQYGSWTAWDVYFDGSDNKYSYFSGGKKPVPVVGQKIAFMEFEAVTKGQYTNRTIKKMVFGQTPPEKPQEAPQTNGNKAYIDHGKCVLTLMEMAGGENCDVGILETLIGIFRMGIKAMLKEDADEDHSQEEAPSSAGEFDEPPPIDPEDAPF